MRALPARSGVAALLLLAAAAWALSAVRMDGMDAGPASHLGSLGWYAATWLLMMAAMMLPSLVPTLPARARADAPFVGGYLLAWAAAGLVAYALIEAVRELEPGFPGLGRNRPLRGGWRHLGRGAVRAQPLEARLPAPLPRPLAEHHASRRAPEGRSAAAWSTGWPAWGAVGR